MIPTRGDCKIKATASDLYVAVPCMPWFFVKTTPLRPRAYETPQRVLLQNIHKNHYHLSFYLVINTKTNTLYK